MKPFFRVLCLVCLLLVAAIPAMASPIISGISPASAPNDGAVTVTITGTGFTSGSSVKLIPPSSTEPPVWGTIVSWSPTSITCTFPIQGRTPNRYTVWVNSPFTSPNGMYYPEDMGMLTSAFTISQGTGTTATPTATLPSTGNISVVSIPPGANIYLDNEYKGLTPLTLKNVENGNRVVLIRLAGYQDYTDMVPVLGNTPTVSARLVPIPISTTIRITLPSTTLSLPTPVPAAPTTASLPGIEIGIIAILGAALLVMRRR